MKGFDANVPKRKPRTRLGTMLADLDDGATEVAEDAPMAAEVRGPTAVEEVEVLAETTPPIARAPAPEPEPAPAADAALVAVTQAAPPLAPLETAAPAPRRAPADARAAAPKAAPVTPPAEAPALPRSPSPEPARARSAAKPPEAPKAAPARPRSPAPGGEVVEAGRARLDALRQRLAAAELARQPAAAPEATATRVRETVAHLKQRLDEVLGERKVLLEALEASRGQVAGLEQQLERERATRATAEALAEERGRVADELMGESEALADERDQALTRIAELQHLDAEQVRLLEEMEGTLAQRDQALAAAHQAAEALRHGLEAAQTDLALTQTELDEARDARRGLERQVEALQAQLARAEAAKAALSEIQRLVDGVG
jgi:hypothetical protein